MPTDITEALRPASEAGTSLIDFLFWAAAMLGFVVGVRGLWIVGREMMKDPARQGRQDLGKGWRWVVAGTVLGASLLVANVVKRAFTGPGGEGVGAPSAERFSDAPFNAPPPPKPKK